MTEGRGGLEVGGHDRAGILYGAIEPSFRVGKLRGKVEAQQYLSVEGNNLIMPSVGVDANGNGYLAFTLVHAGRSHHFPSAAGEDLARPLRLEDEDRGGGPRPPGRV